MNYFTTFAKVKIFNYILTIYLAVLFCMPCSDNEQSTFEVATTKIENAKENHSQKHKDDSCSSFCSCSRCGRNVVVYQQIPANFIGHSSNEFYSSEFFHIPNPYSNYFGSIWQPPQLG